ncbi:hypothetical protein BOTNAR_0192g00140 [Botryotinia narcissicola]|uniref:LysM domain-containing protein n=1 Tax=Botryotinia narcissicola TaxID=278944 RepID=A0A4Z1I8I7_9HELO|nr:hypothetical protein BOTNAR_0192g00140 [Botryotinia narcissicola]
MSIHEPSSTPSTLPKPSISSVHEVPPVHTHGSPSTNQGSCVPHIHGGSCGESTHDLPLTPSTLSKSPTSSIHEVPPISTTHGGSPPQYAPCIPHIHGDSCTMPSIPEHHSSPSSSKTPSTLPSTYTVKPGDVLFSVAKDNGILLHTLEPLNPQITNPDLLQPGQVINLEAQTPSSPSTYTVRKGDCLDSISKELGVPLVELKAANPQISNFELIHPGEVIKLPSNGTTVIVKPGDTLSSLAAANKVSLQALEAANSGIHDYNSIAPGQTINIPPSNAAHGKEHTHVVKPGDTLFNIANANGVTLDALKTANPNIIMVNSLWPGETVKIPGTSEDNHKTYTVQPKDTIFDLAHKFGVSLKDLEHANPHIQNFEQIKPGDLINFPEHKPKSKRRLNSVKFRS